MQLSWSCQENQIQHFPDICCQILLIFTISGQISREIPDFQKSRYSYEIKSYSNQNPIVFEVIINEINILNTAAIKSTLYCTLLSIFHHNYLIINYELIDNQQVNHVAEKI